MTESPLAPDDSKILIYESDSGETHLEVRLQGKTVWLTLNLIAELYNTTKQNVSLHIQNIFEEGELAPEATVKKYLTVRQEGPRAVKRLLDYYNLEMIIAVGYRVKSSVATRFRQWATSRLREYIGGAPVAAGRSAPRRRTAPGRAAGNRLVRGARRKSHS